MYLEKNIIDKFYLHEKKYFKKPKFTSLVLLSLIKNFCKKSDKKTFLDIGCANGAVIEFIRKNYKNFNYIGTDVEIKFRKNLKNIGKDIQFYNDDIKKKNSKKIFGDIIYCSGVLSLFNDPKILLKGLIDRSRSGSRIIISSMMNPYDLDVIIKFRDNYSRKKNFNGAGWNMHSIIKISELLKKNKKVKSFKFIKTKFPKKLKVAQKKKNQLRSWTVKFNNELLFMNGLCTIQHHYFLIINIK